MIIQSTIKNFIAVCFLLSAVFCPVLEAQMLTFNPGDTASYEVSQKLKGTIQILLETESGSENSAVGLDVKILSVDPETSSYPIDVELTVRKILVSETDGQTTLQYNSQKPTVITNAALVDYFHKLINRPLQFRIEKEFQVKETTGYLEQIYNEYEAQEELKEDYDHFELGLFGVTPWSFELFLTELFHLSGTDLQLTNCYPVGCHQILNWEDEPMDEEEVDIEEVSFYTVDKIGSKKIHASWEGNAKVDNRLWGTNGEASVKGTVIWDISNPLLQKRTLKAKFAQTVLGIMRVKASVEQTITVSP